jgi:hypothetical protein
VRRLAWGWIPPDRLITTSSPWALNSFPLSRLTGYVFVMVVRDMSNAHAKAYYAWRHLQLDKANHSDRRLWCSKSPSRIFCKILSIFTPCRRSWRMSIVSGSCLVLSASTNSYMASWDLRKLPMVFSSSISLRLAAVCLDSAGAVLYLHVRPLRMQAEHFGRPPLH